MLISSSSFFVMRSRCSSRFFRILIVLRRNKTTGHKASAMTAINMVMSVMLFIIRYFRLNEKTVFLFSEIPMLMLISVLGSEMSQDNHSNRFLNIQII